MRFLISLRVVAEGSSEVEAGNEYEAASKAVRFPDSLRRSLGRNDFRFHRIQNTKFNVRPGLYRIGQKVTAETSIKLSGKDEGDVRLKVTPHLEKVRVLLGCKSIEGDVTRVLQQGCADFPGQ